MREMTFCSLKLLILSNKVYISLVSKEKAKWNSHYKRSISRLEFVIEIKVMDLALAFYAFCGKVL
jgi:hypothetical protein